MYDKISLINVANSMDKYFPIVPVITIKMISTAELSQFMTMFN